MRFGWCIFPIFALAGCASQPVIAPNGVVSNNPCIDAVLAEIALPGQVAAISSYSHDPDSASAPLAWSAKLPAIGTGAEELLLARPKLVLTGNLAASGANAVLETFDMNKNGAIDYGACVRPAPLLLTQLRPP